MEDFLQLRNQILGICREHPQFIDCISNSLEEMTKKLSSIYCGNNGTFYSTDILSTNQTCEKNGDSTTINENVSIPQISTKVFIENRFGKSDKQDYDQMILNFDRNDEISGRKSPKSFNNIISKNIGGQQIHQAPQARHNSKEFSISSLLINSDNTSSELSNNDEIPIDTFSPVPISTEKENKNNIGTNCHNNINMNITAIHNNSNNYNNNQIIGNNNIINNHNHHGNSSNVFENDNNGNNINNQNIFTFNDSNKGESFEKSEQFPKQLPTQSNHAFNEFKNISTLLQPKRKRGRPPKKSQTVQIINPTLQWPIGGQIVPIGTPITGIPSPPPPQTLEQSVSWNFMCSFFGKPVKFPALMRLIDEIKSVKLIPFQKSKNMRKMDLVKWLDDHWQIVLPFLQSMSPENKRNLISFVAD